MRASASGLAGPAGSYPGQLARLLRIDRRPRGVGQAGLGVALNHGQEWLERLRVIVHGQPGVADAVQSGRERSDRELVRVHLTDFVPAQRRRHLCSWPRPDGPRAENSLMRSVLIEVDENPLASLLLPPDRRDQVRSPAL